jgi:hypothetical protein
MKELKDEPYTQAEADAAAGLGKDNRRRDGQGNLLEPSTSDEVMA